MKTDIAELIHRRREQMLVHSYIYYKLNDNIIDDVTWSKWAMELQQLQKDYPEISKQVVDYELFKDWDGSTGAFLKFSTRVKNKAKYLLSINNISVQPPKTIKKCSKSKKKLF